MKAAMLPFLEIIILAGSLSVKIVASSTNSTTELDAEDFLNVYFLPSTLVLESNLVGDGSILVDNDTMNRNADVDSALSTMSYHRSMINRYLCRNYLANEILSEVERSDVKSDRLGMAAKSGKPQSRIQYKNTPIDQNELLDDEGSDNYKKWLAKSSIFEDIYKHHSSGSSDGDQSAAGSSSNMQLYESGDITGYAVQHSSEDGTKEKQASQLYDQYLPPWASGAGGGPPAANVPVSPPAIHTHHHKYGGDQVGLPVPPLVDYGGHSGIDGFGGAGHGYNHLPDHHVHLDHDHGHYHGHSHGYIHGHGHDEEKGLALKDLFDLALTALAFLAFGMFVLNLILTCFSVQPPTVVMQMTGGDGEGGDTRFTRVKRGAATINVDHLNQLSYSVVSSIDALASIQGATEDHCLRLALCNNNRFARKLLTADQQIWVPVWSFGLSWMSGKIKGRPESMMEYLRAIILGMGKAQCEKIYPQYGHHPPMMEPRVPKWPSALE